MWPTIKAGSGRQAESLYLVVQCLFSGESLWWVLKYDTKIFTLIPTPICSSICLYPRPPCPNLSMFFLSYPWAAIQAICLPHVPVYILLTEPSFMQSEWPGSLLQALPIEREFWLKKIYISMVDLAYWVSQSVVSISPLKLNCFSRISTLSERTSLLGKRKPILKHIGSF